MQMGCEKKAIEQVKQMLKNENAPFQHRLSDMDILRFLREKGFDVQKTHSAIHYDQVCLFLSFFFLRCDF